MSIVWSDNRALDALSYDEKFTAASIKIAALAFALAKCRPVIAWDVDHPFHNASNDHTAWATRLLAEIDSALDGTIHSFTKNGAVR